jgi:hypothetical protein
MAGPFLLANKDGSQPTADVSVYVAKGTDTGAKPKISYPARQVSI